MPESDLQQTIEGMTRLEALAYLDSRIEALHNDIECFGPTAEDILRLNEYRQARIAAHDSEVVDANP
jgi:hypothetical protein